MNATTLARFGIGAVIACLAAPGIASAAPTLNPSGTLTFSWHGDPARGCQAAGVCGVSGSLVVIPQDQSGSSESPPSRNISIEDDAAVVRVTDPGSTPDQPHVCTDLEAVNFQLLIVRPRSGGLRALAGPFQTPTSGDCAGPLALALADFTLPARRLPGRGEAYNLSSTQRFGAGPYEVMLASTIRARRSAGSPPGNGLGVSSSSSSGSSGSGPRPHKGLVEQVSLEYRITSTSGKLTTAFEGRPDPLCVPLDACGVTGTLTAAISGAAGQLEVDAQRVVSRRRSRRAALADLGSGRLPLVQTGVLLNDVLSAHVGWPAGSACTNSVSQRNTLSLDLVEARHRSNVLISLATDPPQDPFRTACPGPGAADVLGSSATLARGVLPIRALGRRSVRIALSGHGRFVAGSYSGSRGGGVRLALRLVRVRAGTKTEYVFPGEP